MLPKRYAHLDPLELEFGELSDSSGDEIDCPAVQSVDGVEDSAGMIPDEQVSCISESYMELPEDDTSSVRLSISSAQAFSLRNEEEDMDVIQSSQILASQILDSPISSNPPALLRYLSLHILQNSPDCESIVLSMKTIRNLNIPRSTGSIYLRATLFTTYTQVGNFCVIPLQPIKGKIGSFSFPSFHKIVARIPNEKLRLKLEFVSEGKVHGITFCPLEQTKRIFLRFSQRPPADCTIQSDRTQKRSRIVEPFIEVKISKTTQHSKRSKTLPPCTIIPYDTFEANLLFRRLHRKAASGPLEGLQRLACCSNVLSDIDLCKKSLNHYKQAKKKGIQNKSELFAESLRWIVLNENMPAFHTDQLHELFPPIHPLI